MAGNKITNTLVANITAQEDSTQNIPINRGTGNPSFDSVLAQMTEYYVLITSGVNVIPLPAPICYQLYIRNLDAALTIRPLLTAQSQSAADLPILFPGDQMIIWQSNSNATAGFTALSLITSGANALVEFFIGA